MNNLMYMQQPYNCLCFHGEDALRIAQLVLYLQRVYLEVLDKCIVYIEGLYTRSSDCSAKILSTPVKAEVNGYVRRIVVRSIHNKTLYDVGGSSATLEDVASKRIHFLFFGLDSEWETSIVRNQDLALHQTIPNDPPTDAELDLHVKRGDYMRAITAAKILATPRAANILLDYLHSDLYKYEKAGDDLIRLSDAFIPFHQLCKDKPDLSLKITRGLIEYIQKRTETPNRMNHIVCSVIYCIEALGYVTGEANSQAAEEACHLLTEIVGSDRICRIHPHIIWAVVVALGKIVHSNLDINQIHMLRRRLESSELQQTIPGLEETLNCSINKHGKFGFNPRISEMIYKEAIKLTAAYCKKRESSNLEMLFKSLGLNNSDLENIKHATHVEELSNQCPAKVNPETMNENKIINKIMKNAKILSWEMAKEVMKEIVRIWMRT
ncbi:MAG: hypothetical protein E3J73_08660 [Candidatus Bathyarchaeum sp.]|nr:MAG: hypothetical protein E3J73_08660 [Candidatus Bathyarchaeum sp.]